MDDPTYLDPDPEGFGFFTAFIVEKKKGRRAHVRHDWPPLNSAMRPGGLVLSRCTRWLERTITRIIKNEGGRVIHAGIDEVQSKLETFKP